MSKVLQQDKRVVILTKDEKQKNIMADQDLLLSKHEQTVNNISEVQDQYMNDSSPPQQHQKYIKQEHSNLKNDYHDVNDLQEEIQRIKKIKNEYKEQKQQIQQLSKIVENLKTENKSLKLEKQSIREDSQRKSRQNSPSQKSRKVTGNIVHVNQAKNCKQNSKIHDFTQNINFQRYMSPQMNKSLPNEGYSHLKRKSKNESYNHQFLKISEQIATKNHHHNKRAVIASFVEELKQQLEQNEAFLQNQKRMHRQTREKLQICLQELSDLRLKTERIKSFEAIERQNLYLKDQLQVELEQRLLTEERLMQKESLMSEYERGYLTQCSEFDRQLDRMDEIYFNFQQTLKI